jgi:hypothetical protein
MAMIDDDSYFVESILGYKGDPDRRMDMQFLIRFKDQEEVWRPYDYSSFQLQAYELQEIGELQAYEHFCTLRP